MGNRDSDSLNNHWRHKARAILPIVNARLDAVTKERDAAAHKLSEWLNTQALLLACGELSAQEIRVVKAVLNSRIAAILTLDPAAIVRDQSNDLH